MGTKAETETTTSVRQVNLLQHLGVNRIDSVNSQSISELFPTEKWVTELRLDFSGISFISSLGLRELLTLRKRMEVSNCKLVLTGLTGRPLETFVLVGFTSIFTIE